MKTRTLIAGLSALTVVPGGLWAQSYRDLTFVRGRPSAYSSVLQARAGVLAGFPSDETPAIGLEDKVGWDGHVYYHQDRFGERQAVLDAYAGRDGAYFGVVEGELLGQETQSRLELTARYFPFYREGFYRGDHFIPTGRYEGFDYGARLTVAREVAENVRFETGGFYRRMTFDRNEDTAINFSIPDDYNAYGGVLLLEHNTLVLDRVTGRPDHGFILTAGVEREWNNSSALVGIPGVFASKLPSAVWRGRGHLEWYLAQSQTTTWEVEIDGSISDDEDRVYNSDAQKPIGHLWVDGSLGFRVELGLAFWVTPYGKAQFVKVLQDSGVGSQDELFFGGGVAAGYEAADNISILFDYSFLSNESREPISATEDTFGEHQLFLGLEARFGATR